MMFSHPGFYCVVAEFEGKIAGSNAWMNGRRSRASVHNRQRSDSEPKNRPRADAGGAKPRRGEKIPGSETFAGSFPQSFAFAVPKLGFEVREFVSVMQGPPIKPSMSGATSWAMRGYQVRTASEADVESCNSLCQAVHGHERGGELTDAIKQGTAVVAEHGGGLPHCNVIGSLGTRWAEPIMTCKPCSPALPRFLVRAFWCRRVMPGSFGGAWKMA